MSETPSATVAGLYRYPVKGLTPEPMVEAHLVEGGYFPGDRVLAIENGPSGSEPSAPTFLPKQKFLMLMRNARLARLTTEFDSATRWLTIRQGGLAAAAGSIDTVEGRLAIAGFLKTYLGDECREPLQVLDAPDGFRFVDSQSGFVSLINLASVRAIAGLVKRDGLDPLRFRGNILLDGLRAWGEFEHLGARLAIGTAELEITKRIDRCAAVDVDPKAGLRDLNIVSVLEQAFQHHDCGVYARITRSGVIRTGDAMQIR
ncbi:COG3217 Uncharacterized Fe-S protein [Rhabdaerophilaceae bacterium]